jgi:hypothetical protein
MHAQLHYVLGLALEVYGKLIQHYERSQSQQVTIYKRTVTTTYNR